MSEITESVLTPLETVQTVASTENIPAQETTVHETQSVVDSQEQVINPVESPATQEVVPLTEPIQLAVPTETVAVAQPVEALPNEHLQSDDSHVEALITNAYRSSAEDALEALSRTVTSAPEQQAA